MNAPPAYTVTVLTRGAMYRFGYRFVVVGPGETVWKHYKALRNARRAANTLNRMGSEQGGRMRRDADGAV